MKILEFLNAYVKHDQAASQFITHAPAENGVPKYLISVDLRHISITQEKDDLPATK